MRRRVGVDSRQSADFRSTRLVLGHLERVGGGKKLRPFVVDVDHVDDEHRGAGERRRTAAVDRTHAHPVARHHFAVEHGPRGHRARVWIDFEHPAGVTVVVDAVHDPSVGSWVGVGGVQLCNERADEVVFEEVCDVDGSVEPRTDVVDIEDTDGQLADTDQCRMTVVSTYELDVVATNVPTTLTIRYDTTRSTKKPA